MSVSKIPESRFPETRIFNIRTVTKISQQVIATYRRKNSASPYQELVYKAKKIDWDTITFPKEYDYLTKPRKDGA